MSKEVKTNAMRFLDTKKILVEITHSKALRPLLLQIQMNHTQTGRWMNLNSSLQRTRVMMLIFIHS